MRPSAACALLLLLLPYPGGASAAGLRYEQGSNLIVVDGTATTLSALKAALPQAPLALVDAERKTWLLSANVLLTNGAILRLHGRRARGDVDELRLRSDNLPGPRAFVSLTADHGTLDIRATRVTSWDTAANEPDREHASYGRAFIRARSRMKSAVLTRLESRMDVIDSEVQYLGYDASESYGLVWKLVAPDDYVFQHARVWGNVMRSKIHHNYFGLYAAGARGNEWVGNDIHHNVQYGMAPHTHSDDLLIEDNQVHDNGHHGITVRQGCARVRVRKNRVWANRENGIALHRDANGGEVVGNQVFDNAGSGVSVYDSAGVTVRGNTVRNNGRSGIQLAMNASHNRVEHNDVRDNRFYGVFVGKGSGRAADGRDGMPRRNHIIDNRVQGSGIADLRMGEPSLNEWIANAGPAGPSRTGTAARPAPPPAPSLPP
jgi:parallel beta-helix repeat protein